jgi:catechol 2,3-dioxygenase-like lactoylglutathione lyase family enzyme
VWRADRRIVAVEADMALFDSRGIDHVGIRYRDLPRALAWFRDVLGLAVDHETTTMAFIRVGSDGAHLALFQAEGDEPLRQPHHVALRVPDVGAAEAAVGAAGIPLRRFGPNLGFQDTEGNVFHFMPAR